MVVINAISNILHVTTQFSNIAPASRCHMLPLYPHMSAIVAGCPAPLHSCFIP